MSGLSRRLKQLDEELLALGEETMLLEELDGFIAGLLVCPDLTMSTGFSVSSWNIITVSRGRSWSAPTATVHCSPSTPAMVTSSGSFGSRLRESRRVTTGSLAKTPQRRCRYGGRHARNDGARRRRLPRSTPATRGP
jgi:hypothetical protein